MAVSVITVCVQLVEVKNIPASSEKIISEATDRKEQLEVQKVKEEEKLATVMESLKEETKGLQQEKEVSRVCVCVCVKIKRTEKRGRGSAVWQ